MRGIRGSQAVVSSMGAGVRELRRSNGQFKVLAEQAIRDKTKPDNHGRIERFQASWQAYQDILNERPPTTKDKENFREQSQTLAEALKTIIPLIDQAKDLDPSLLEDLGYKFNSTWSDYRQALIAADRGPAALREASLEIDSQTIALGALYDLDIQNIHNSPAVGHVTEAEKIGRGQRQALSLLNEWEDEQLTIISSAQKAVDFIFRVGFERSRVEELQEDGDFSEAAEYEQSLESIFTDKDEIINLAWDAINRLQDQVKDS
jgi:hypothetical protein